MLTEIVKGKTYLTRSGLRATMKRQNGHMFDANVGGTYIADMLILRSDGTTLSWSVWGNGSKVGMGGTDKYPNDIVSEVGIDEPEQLGLFDL